MEKRRVVITGSGVISPVGTGIEKFWKALLEGESGIRPITHFDASQFDSQICGNVIDYNPEDYFSKKEARHLSRFVQFAVVAAKEAITHAQLDLNGIDLTRMGVVIGSGIGSMQTMEHEHDVFLKRGPKKISPFLIPKLIVNEAAGQVSIVTGAKGPAICVVTACASGTNSIGDAFRMIQYGDADIMLAGGSESANTVLGIGGFSALKALSTRNDEPQKASRPFDLNRDGFIMGEGAGIVVLEELQHAQRRKAPIWAEITGYGTTSDAHHITAPEPTGQGATQAMELAIKNADLTPDDISYINAHGTSTKLNDKVETLAIKNLFKEQAHKVAISSTKSMTGHLLGAAGGIECIVCILAVRDDIVPPTINYETPDPDCDLDYVPNTARKIIVETAMSNSLGFGGHNATIIIEKFKA